ncbi:hypothetical protein SAMN05442782_8241 [Streptomyces sp. OK228]|nr:hypothetical protein SAMN05442782_8241 [Streptomyces sp. OK228]
MLGAANDWMPGTLRDLILRADGIAPRRPETDGARLRSRPTGYPQPGRFPLWNIHTKGSFIMNSAPQVQTLEISDAELDTVSGGLSPQVGMAAGPTAISSSNLVGQFGAVKDEVLDTVGQYHQVGLTVSF